MPHAQTRMATLFDVAWRTAETEDEKIAQALFGALEIFVPVEGPEQIVLRNLPVKSGDQTFKAPFAHYRIDLAVFHHPTMLARGDERCGLEPAPRERLG